MELETKVFASYMLLVTKNDDERESWIHGLGHGLLKMPLHTPESLEIGLYLKMWSLALNSVQLELLLS